MWRLPGQGRIGHGKALIRLKIFARGHKFALASEHSLAQNRRMKPAGWLARVNAETVAQFEFKLRARFR